MATLQLGNLHFAWDGEKAASNLTKHGVSFYEAATAFLDEYAEMNSDPIIQMRSIVFYCWRPPQSGECL